MKIIHIVENLDRGAVENWLVNIFIESRRLRPDWQWTFYCILGREGKLDEKVRRAGGNIIYSPVTVSDKPGFLKNLRNELNRGKYDILHAHHDYLSGFYLIASTGIKFKKRFLQVHNTDKSLPVGNKILHHFLLKPFRILGTSLSDTVIGISENTLGEFVHTTKLNSSRHALLYYGVDMNRFNIAPEREKIRESLQLPTNSKILLYTGRMNDLKNPVFVVEVLNELLKKRNDVYAVFVGTGDREQQVEETGVKHKIADQIRIAGWHDDVPLLMKSADVFVFPRKLQPKEGLGLVVVEAQAAGLPMFITSGIVRDAIEIPALAHFNDPVDAVEWARQIDEVLNAPVAITQTEALEIMKRSKFELNNATKNLIDLYER